jgi:hypothetical protein
VRDRERAVAQLPQPLLEGRPLLFGETFPRSVAFAARRKHSNSPSSGFIEPILWLSAQLQDRDQDALARGAAPLALGLLAAFSIARSGRPPLPVRDDLTRLVREGGGRTSLSTEELIELENARRRCGGCRSGRGWRRFELVRPAQGEPIVLCGGCRARFGDDPPVGREPAPALEPVPAVAEPPAPPQPRPGGRGTDRRPDRLRAALGKLPSSFSTAMAARAAGLNRDKALARLEDLERRGEVRRVGKRWSTESPPSDVAAAMDRLAARTSNLRIVRERAREAGLRNDAYV